MEKVIETSSLFFRYDRRFVLDDISLSVNRGSFVSIIGPNGSGKTTLLRNISGIISPHKGSIALKGRDVSQYGRKEIARFMAYVPQTMAMDFSFTVGDIVLMGRAPYIGIFESETPDDIKIVNEAMEITNITSLKEKRVTEISGGEKQRVMIACALAQTPEIMLLDEPVSNLDIQHQVETMNILKKLNSEKGMTVIVVLHDLNLAAEYSDTVMLLKDGKLLCSGTPSEVISLENISMAYETKVYMTENPFSGNPHIIPVY